MIAIRIILLLLPLFGVIYYLRWRHRLKVSGQDADDADLKHIRSVLLVIIASLIAMLLLWRFLDTTSTDRYKVYVPPHVVDGKVVPGAFIDEEETPEAEEATETKDPAKQE